MAHRFASEVNTTKLSEFINELHQIGCCDLCVIRYLGVTEPNVYRDNIAIKKILDIGISSTKDDNVTGNGYSCDKEAKQLKRNTCVACMGLLQDGIQDPWLDKIAAEITSNGIEAVSYCPALSLPICAQIRAYSIWFHLKKKFGNFLQPIEDLKPEGVNVKASWKWICSYSLRQKVDPRSEWGNSGNVKIEITPKYEDDKKECEPLSSYIIKRKKGKSFHSDIVTRAAVEANFKKMDSDDFFQCFESPPSIPTNSVTVGSVKCSHEPIFIAGRYCKYSRQLSQTPWIIDNVRKTELSVEELISRHILSLLNASECKFSASGREDVDVRTLGKGRPFVFEVINPKRTVFSTERMKTLQDKINTTTTLIFVRDVQVVEKKDLGKLKHGEESKSKVYSALCVLPGRAVMSEHIETLNSCHLPITLQQKTPIRVLHRRSLATRERRILEMSAVLIENNSEMFKLFVRTDAGTYVKEFVHGDFGRTQPNIATILGVDADILALDVMEVALDWPPELQ